MSEQLVQNIFCDRAARFELPPDCLLPQLCAMPVFPSKGRSMVDIEVAQFEKCLPDGQCARAAEA